MGLVLPQVPLRLASTLAGRPCILPAWPWRCPWRPPRMGQRTLSRSSLANRQLPLLDGPVAAAGTDAVSNNMNVPALALPA
jgi:hypothetical protein